jgi:hypothetical protein
MRATLSHIFHVSNQEWHWLLYMPTILVLFLRIRNCEHLILLKVSFYCSALKNVNVRAALFRSLRSTNATGNMWKITQLKPTELDTNRPKRETGMSFVHLELYSLNLWFSDYKTSTNCNTRRKRRSELKKEDADFILRKIWAYWLIWVLHMNVAKFLMNWNRSPLNHAPCSLNFFQYGMKFLVFHHFLCFRETSRTYVSVYISIDSAFWSYSFLGDSFPLTLLTVSKLSMNTQISDIWMMGSLCGKWILKCEHDYSISNFMSQNTCSIVFSTTLWFCNDFLSVILHAVFL